MRSGNRRVTAIKILVEEFAFLAEAVELYLEFTFEEFFQIVAGQSLAPVLSLIVCHVRILSSLGHPSDLADAGSIKTDGDTVSPPVYG